MKYQKIIDAALTICALLLSLAGCAPDFEGNCVKSTDCYVLDIEEMNGADLHTLELEQGDTLQIQFETEKGSLSMKIMAPDGTAVYTGNGKETTEFTLNIPADGTYTVSVEGKKARGNIRVDVEKAPEFTAEELAGPWHLEPGENDEDALNEAFPGAMEFGAGMEITGDGNISWYIGIEGGSGTYTLDGDTLTANIVSDLEQQPVTVLFRVTAGGETARLEMDYKETTVYWAYGASGELSAAGE